MLSDKRIILFGTFPPQPYHFTDDYYPVRTFSFRNLRGSSGPIDDSFDPALKGLSLPELYRMLEVIDMVESKKTNRVSNKDIETLNYLLNAYDQ